jgi:hypothetical protein
MVVNATILFRHALVRLLRDGRKDRLRYVVMRSIVGACLGGDNHPNKLARMRLTLGRSRSWGLAISEMTSLTRHHDLETEHLLRGRKE